MDPGTALAVGQVSASVLKLIWKYYGDVKDAKSDIQSLANELKDFQNVTLEIQKLHQSQQANTDFPVSSDLASTMEQSLSHLKNLELKLDPGTGDKLMKRVGRRALKWPFTKREVAEWVSKLQRFKSTLNLALNADMVSLIVDIKDLQITREQERLLEKLPMASEASFDSYHRQYEPKCMADTRVELLQHLQDWGTHHRQPIFWLRGMAGTGKSTISRTLAEIFDDQNLLGGSFFFSRSSGEANNASRFVGTLANQLASTKPQLRHCICEAISANSDALRQGLRNQWKAFISGPLSNAKFQRKPTINIVIDALDECASDDDISLLLQLFVETRAIDNVDLGVFVTSRPETAIRFEFNRMPEVIHYDLDLHNIPREVVEHDISVYLRQELSLIRTERSLDQWPSESDFQALVLRAGSLFIYAAAACRFIRDKYWDPVERLSSILGTEAADDGSTSQIDNMYRQVLRVSLIEGRSGGEVVKLCDRFKLVVGSVIVLFDELSISSLANLLLISDKLVEACLSSLHSVLNISKHPQSPISLLHPSFRDFLLDERRCGDGRFFQEVAWIHEKLATSCLKVISTSLRRNICHLPTPGSQLYDVSKEELSLQLPKHVQYACKYWAEHLRCIKQDSTIWLSDNGAVQLFFQKSFLNWLEVMSLMGQMTQAVLMMTTLSQTIETLHSDQKNADRARYLIPLIEDANRFILSHRTIIEKAPLQVYSSALVFSPSQSIIRNTYSDSIPTWLHIPPKVSANWDNCVQTLENPHSTCSVAFSHDDKYLACGLLMGILCLWDMTTGALHSSLDSYKGQRLTSMVFSPDGILAIAYQGAKIQLLHPSTGRKIYEKNLSPIISQKSNLSSKPAQPQMIEMEVSLAFLPNSKLAIYCAKKEVYIWDWKHNELSERLYPKFSRCMCLDSSPKGKLLLDCRERGIPNSNYLVHDPDGGTTAPLNVFETSEKCCAAAISDQYAAIASRTGSLKILDLITGSSYEYGGPAEPLRISNLVFSLNGAYLGIGYKEGIIESLDLQKRQRKVIGRCRINRKMTFLTLSSDGGTFASICDFGRGAQIWKNIVGSKPTSEGVNLFRGEVSPWNVSALVSPGLDLMAIYPYSLNTTLISLYDIANGDLALELRHKHKVEDFRFSADGRLLAARCEDKSVSIWNLQRNVTTKATLIDRFNFNEHRIEKLVFSPNSKQLALLYEDHSDKNIQIRSTVEATRVYRLQPSGLAGPSLITNFVYSPTGTLIACQYTYAIMIFDTMNGSLLHSIGASDPLAIAFALDSISFAYITGKNVIEVYDLETKQAVKTISIVDGSGTFQSPLAYLALSADGESLAYSIGESYSNTNTFHILKIDTAQVVDSIQIARVTPELELAKDGSYLDTSRGRFRISQPGGHSNRASSNIRSCWNVQQEWVYEGDRKMLWLPPDYRPRTIAHRDGFFVLLTKSGCIISMGFSKEPVLAEEEQQETTPD